jgi:outer membrane biogenesis lipoprotein LolB
MINAMPISVLKKLTVAIAVTTLTACASIRPVQDANDPVGFNMNGRFGIQYIEDGKDKSNTGKIEWQETRQATDITLATPLGNAMANLHITRNEAVLKTADGDMYVEKTPEELLARLLGYELPISLIKEALGRAGKPAPDQIGNNEWQLSVVSRFDNGTPKKLIAERLKPSPLTMTVFIDERSDAME